MSRYLIETSAVDGYLLEDASGVLIFEGTEVIALPSAAALVVTGATPAVLTPRKALPSAAALVLTAATPAVATPRRAAPSAPALVVAGVAPTVAVTANLTVQPDYAVLNLRTERPAVEAIEQLEAAVGGTLPRPREPLPPRPVPITSAPAGARLSLLTSIPAVVINDDELVLALAA